MPTFFIIIVNYNGKNLLKSCLDSLHKQTCKEFSVMVVDNNSTDGSKEMIANDYPEVLLLPLKTNTLFAVANNQGIREAIARPEIEYVLLLNNDTVCDPSFIEELIIFVTKNKSPGMVATKMLFFDKPEMINNAGGMIRENGCFDGRGFGEQDAPLFNDQKEVFAPSGGAGLYSVQLLKEIQYNGNFFDDFFFAYHEDIDLAFRARLLGWTCTYNPRAVIYHHHSATFGNSSQKKKYWCLRNNILCLYKCLPVSVFKKVWWRIVPYFFLKMLKQLILFDFCSVKGIVEGVHGTAKMREKRSFIQSSKKVTDEVVLGWIRGNYQ